MSWLKPTAKVVAQRIDNKFKNEKDPSYYTAEKTDPAKQRLFDEVVDEIYVFSLQKWMAHQNLSTRVMRLDKVRTNANDVLKYSKNAAASSMISRATDVSLQQLDHRATNKIPLFAGVTPGTNRFFTSALVAPASDAGNANALARTNSLTGSVISNREPPPSEMNP